MGMDIWDWIGGTGGIGTHVGRIGRALYPKKPTRMGPQMDPGFGAAGSGLGGGGLKSTTPRINPMDAILAELQRLQDPSRYSIDPSLLRQQAEASASAQYDPVIAALRRQASGAQTTATRNAQQLNSMYSGLSSSLMSEIAPIQQRFADTQAKTDTQYQQLQDKIKSQYAASQAEQEEMMKRLNIEAAAPDALKESQDDLSLILSNTASEGQNVRSQLEQQGQGAVNFTQQGAQIARAEGTNRQADLLAALQATLDDIRGKIGDAQSARSATVEGSLASLMQGSQTEAVQRAQRDFENYIKVLGVTQDLTKGQQAGPVKSPADVGARAMSLGLDMGQSQAVQDAFMTALSSDDLILSSVDPNSGLKLSNEALANRVVEMGRQMRLTTSQLNALQNIALEYFRG